MRLLIKGYFNKIYILIDKHTIICKYFFIYKRYCLRGDFCERKVKIFEAKSVEVAWEFWDLYNEGLLRKDNLYWQGEGVEE